MEAHRCAPLSVHLLGNGLKLVLQSVQLTLHVSNILIYSECSDTVLGEQRCHESVGVTDNRCRDTLIDDPVQSEHNGQPLPGPHGHEDRSEIAYQDLPKERKLLDDLTGS